jgi:hypothetical protein
MEGCDHGLSRDLAKGTEESHVTHMPGYPVSGARFEPGLPEYEELLTRPPALARTFSNNFCDGI